MVANKLVFLLNFTQELSQNLTVFFFLFWFMGKSVYFFYYILLDTLDESASLGSDSQIYGRKENMPVFFSSFIFFLSNYSYL